MDKNANDCVYILSNKNNSALYVGVTQDILERIRFRKSGKAAGYCMRNRCYKLVWYYDKKTYVGAVAYRGKLREQNQLGLKKLVEESNANWVDIALRWK